MVRRCFLPEGEPASAEQSSRRVVNILDLPVELFWKIAETSSPASVIILGLTCRKLHGMLQYTARDILRCLPYVIPNQDHFHQDLSRINEVFRHQASQVARSLQADTNERLAPAEYAYLLEQAFGRPAQLLTCSTCAATHPCSWFSPEQQLRSPKFRVCRAAEATIWLCDHLRLDFRQLRHLRSQPASCNDVPFAKFAGCLYLQQEPSLHG